MSQLEGMQGQEVLLRAVERKTKDGDIFIFTANKETKDTKLGVSFKKKDGVVSISRIKEDSLFAKTDLKVGDQLVRVDDIASEGKSTKEISQVTKAKEGSISLVVKRTSAPPGKQNNNQYLVESSAKKSKNGSMGEKDVEEGDRVVKETTIRKHPSKREKSDAKNSPIAKNKKESITPEPPGKQNEKQDFVEDSSKKAKNGSLVRKNPEEGDGSAKDVTTGKHPPKREKRSVKKSQRAKDKESSTTPGLPPKKQSVDQTSAESSAKKSKNGSLERKHNEGDRDGKDTTSRGTHPLNRGKSRAKKLQFAKEKEASTFSVAKQKPGPFVEQSVEQGVTESSLEKSKSKNEKEVTASIHPPKGEPSVGRKFFSKRQLSLKRSLFSKTAESKTAGGTREGLKKEVPAQISTTLAPEESQNIEEIKYLFINTTIRKDTEESKIGVSVRKQMNGYFDINKIVENGLLSSTPLRVGDELIRVNGTDCIAMSTTDLTHVLSTAKGKLRLTARRERTTKNLLAGTPAEVAPEVLMESILSTLKVHHDSSPILMDNADDTTGDTFSFQDIPPKQEVSGKNEDTSIFASGMFFTASDIDSVFKDLTLLSGEKINEAKNSQEKKETEKAAVAEHLTVTPEEKPELRSEQVQEIVHVDENGNGVKSLNNAKEIINEGSGICAEPKPGVSSLKEPQMKQVKEKGVAKVVDEESPVETNTNHEQATMENPGVTGSTPDPSIDNIKEEEVHPSKLSKEQPRITVIPEDNHEGQPGMSIRNGLKEMQLSNAPAKAAPGENAEHEADQVLPKKDHLDKQNVPDIQLQDQEEKNRDSANTYQKEEPEKPLLASSHEEFPTSSVSEVKQEELEIKPTEMAATVYKESAGVKTGISFEKKQNGAVFVSRLAKNGIFTKTGLSVGDEVMSINGIDCEGSSPKEVAKLISSSVGFITLEARHMPTLDGPAKEVSSNKSPNKLLVGNTTRRLTSTRERQDQEYGKRKSKRKRADVGILPSKRGAYAEPVSTKVSKENTVQGDYSKEGDSNGSTNTGSEEEEVIKRKETIVSSSEKPSLSTPTDHGLYEKEDAVHPSPKKEKEPNNIAVDRDNMSAHLSDQKLLENSDSSDTPGVAESFTEKNEKIEMSVNNTKEISAGTTSKQPATKVASKEDNSKAINHPPSRKRRFRKKALTSLLSNRRSLVFRSRRTDSVTETTGSELTSEEQATGEATGSVTVDSGKGETNESDNDKVELKEAEAAPGLTNASDRHGNYPVVATENSNRESGFGSFLSDWIYGTRPTRESIEHNIEVLQESFRELQLLADDTELVNPTGTQSEKAIGGDSSLDQAVVSERETVAKDIPLARLVSELLVGADPDTQSLDTSHDGGNSLKETESNKEAIETTEEEFPYIFIANSEMHDNESVEPTIVTYTEDSTLKVDNRKKDDSPRSIRKLTKMAGFGSRFAIRKKTRHGNSVIRANRDAVAVASDKDEIKYEVKETDELPDTCAALTLIFNSKSEDCSESDKDDKEKARTATDSGSGKRKKGDEPTPIWKEPSIKKEPSSRAKWIMGGCVADDVTLDSDSDNSLITKSTVSTNDSFSRGSHTSHPVESLELVEDLILPCCCVDSTRLTGEDLDDNSIWSRSADSLDELTPY